MIDFIFGTITEKGSDFVVLNCNGVGYYLNVSVNSLQNLPEIDSETKIYTYLNVQDNAIDLFGFATQQERKIFKKIINVQRIGCRLAIKILSDVKEDQLVEYIISGDIKQLCKINGVGKKTAEQLIFELQKLFKKNYNEITSKKVVSANNDKTTLAIEALVALGYSEKDSSVVVSTIINESKDLDIPDIVKNALQRL